MCNRQNGRSKTRKTDQFFPQLRRRRRRPVQKQFTWLNGEKTRLKRREDHHGGVILIKFQIEKHANNSQSRFRNAQKAETTNARQRANTAEHNFKTEKWKWIRVEFGNRIDKAKMYTARTANCNVDVSSREKNRKGREEWQCWMSRARQKAHEAACIRT